MCGHVPAFESQLAPHQLVVMSDCLSALASCVCWFGTREHSAHSLLLPSSLGSLSRFVRFARDLHQCGAPKGHCRTVASHDRNRHQPTPTRIGLLKVCSRISDSTALVWGRFASLCVGAQKRAVAAPARETGRSKTGAPVRQHCFVRSFAQLLSSDIELAARLAPPDKQFDFGPTLTR